MYLVLIGVCVCCTVRQWTELGPTGKNVKNHLIRHLLLLSLLLSSFHIRFSEIENDIFFLFPRIIILMSENTNKRKIKGKGKGKVIPLQARCGPEAG